MDAGLLTSWYIDVGERQAIKCANENVENGRTVVRSTGEQGGGTNRQYEHIKVVYYLYVSFSLC